MSATNIKAKVLIVEDDPDISSVLGESLEDLGYEVSYAEDGMDGLVKYTTQDFDLVLTDYSMPLMRGNEMLMSLLNYRKDHRAKFVLVTGIPLDTIDTETMNWMNLHFAGIIEKPFSVLKLEEVLNFDAKNLRKTS